MATAGRAVFLSGLTVAIGLVALIVLPVPGLRSVGYRRHAHPVRLRRRRAHAAAGDARRHRPARRLAAAPPRGPRQPRLDRVDARLVVRGRVDRGGGRARRCSRMLIVPVFRLTTGETGASALAKTGRRARAYKRLLAGGVAKRRPHPDRSPRALHATPVRTRTLAARARDRRRSALLCAGQQPRRHDRRARHPRSQTVNAKHARARARRAQRALDATRPA